MSVSIQGKLKQLKAFCLREDVLLSGLIILVSVTSYTLGLYRGGGLVTESVSSSVVKVASVSEAAGYESKRSISVPKETGNTGQEGYVASKNGTKYHLPWCGSAKQIKEENKVFFGTKAEAEAAGYTPASNCPGI